MVVKMVKTIIIIMLKQNRKMFRKRLIYFFHNQICPTADGRGGGGIIKQNECT